MNIYKVTRTTNWSYDQYSSFICFARDSEEAKNLNPSFVEIDHNLIKCDKCTYTIPEHYDQYSDCFFTNDITKQILCEDCFYLENEK
jgi:hypothetical protein